VSKEVIRERFPNLSAFNFSILTRIANKKALIQRMVNCISKEELLFTVFSGFPGMKSVSHDIVVLMRKNLEKLKSIASKEGGFNLSIIENIIGRELPTSTKQRHSRAVLRCITKYFMVSSNSPFQYANLDTVEDRMKCGVPTRRYRTADASTDSSNTKENADQGSSSAYMASISSALIADGITESVEVVEVNLK